MFAFSDFISSLELRLKQKLPGIEAHRILMPPERRGMLKNMPDTSNARKAGVLILFYPLSDQAEIVFIERSQYEGVHSGQIAFPGGAMERIDNNLQQTAVRETQEEIGIPEEKIHIIGRLSKIFIPPSNYVVSPSVGYIDFVPDFVPDPTEVAKVLHFPFRLLMDKSSLTETEIASRNSIFRKIPCFRIGDNIIWGATSMILNELITLLR